MFRYNTYYFYSEEPCMSQFLSWLKIRKRRQIPEYAENAGERYTGNDYDYEYDPNLRLTTPSGDDESDLKEGSKGLSSALSEMTAEEETMPMTDEERAYLEEHYRYQCNS